MMHKMIRCMLVWVMVIYTITAGTAQQTIKAAPEQVSTSSAAVVMEAETSRVLFASNANECMPMASTTKIMTALVHWKTAIRPTSSKSLMKPSVSKDPPSI